MKLPPSEGDLPCLLPGPAFAGFSHFRDFPSVAYSSFTLLFSFLFLSLLYILKSSASRFVSSPLLSMRSHHVTMGFEKVIHVTTT